MPVDPFTAGLLGAAGKWVFNKTTEEVTCKKCGKKSNHLFGGNVSFVCGCAFCTACWNADYEARDHSRCPGCLKKYAEM